MISEDIAQLIMLLAGIMFGYSIGFLMARSIYRPSNKIFTTDENGQTAI